MKRARTLLFLVLLPSAVAAQGHDVDQLGRISFPTSARGATQRQFERGMLFLHSFEYEKAAAAFREAQKLDPAFALAYWGEALTYTHPVWNQQDSVSARDALRRFAPTSAARARRARTDGEREWLVVAEALYGEGSKAARDTAFSDAMATLLEKHPDSHEAKVFLALSLLGLNQGVRDVATYMRAAALAEDVFRENPLHPGAVHFLIHAYDDPIHAPLGLRAARAYSKIAPAAAHAQHMTTHIFLAMGMWDDVVAQNAIASGHDHDQWAPGHYTHWYGYGLLQLGRNREALGHLETVRANLPTTGVGPRAAVLTFMRADYLVNTEDWESPVAAWSIPLAPGFRDARAADLFVRGVHALRRSDRVAADTSLAALMRLAREAESAKAPGGNPLVLQAPVVMELELTALRRMADGNSTEAVELLQRATALEDRMPMEFGPPAIVKPSHELLGDVLLHLGRSVEAKREYERALALAPRRARSLLGLARAAERAGDMKTAHGAWAALKEIWRGADRELPALAEVRRAVDDH